MEVANRGQHQWVVLSPAKPCWFPCWEGKQFGQWSGKFHPTWSFCKALLCSAQPIHLYQATLNEIRLSFLRAGTSVPLVYHSTTHRRH